ncbi:MAG: NCS2 family permease [Acidobacteria bacterium]|nr:NCS2 family permease [Acidobacteriota bacterium]
MKSNQLLERWFHLSENGTTVKTEAMAGLTTFMTMSYVIFVNPAILSKTGMDFGAVLLATVLGAGLTTIFMGLYANYPFALAPGMGLNAYFTYTVVMQMGYRWETALGAVFISGCLFLLLTFVKLRQVIVYAIPDSLKLATAGGIGLFIALIGLKESGIIVANKDTLMALGDVTRPEAILTILGVILTGALLTRKVKGAILIGILALWVAGLIGGLCHFDGIFSMPPSLAPTFLKLDIAGALHIGFFGIVFAFLFVDLFDTTGTLVGIAEHGGFIKENGDFPRVGRALTVDAAGTIAGSLLGTSTVTSYVESSAGVAEGGRTGLTSVFTGILFLLAIFIVPMAKSVPLFAASPALIIIGILMMKSAARIPWDDFTEAIPAFLAMIAIPFTYSIATGIAVGFIIYPLSKVSAGKWREVSVPVWVLMILFIIRFIYLAHR